MSNHTPGPWRQGNSGSIVSDHHPNALCQKTDTERFYGGHFVCESVDGADARLIAASPDLLEALKEITEWWANWMPDNAHAQEGYKALQVALAAIAKAEGEG